jgi:hypothetical protein
VALAQADVSEADVDADLVPNDPLEALLAAQRDGLLSYHGFIGGGRYEVSVSGRRQVMSGPDVLDQVARMRVVERVGAMGGAAVPVRVDDDGTQVYRLGRRQIGVPAQDVVLWYRGYAAAHAAAGQEHAGSDNSAGFKTLFGAPDLNDQRRLVILGLMYGGPGPEIKFEHLAEMIAQLPSVGALPAKKTLVHTLTLGRKPRFGRQLEFADRMLEAFGLRWVGPESAEVERIDGEPLSAPPPEMPIMAVMRQILEASRRGWLRYVDKPGPNDARWLTRLTVAVGQRMYQLPVADFPVWLDGLAAYHGVVRRHA